MHEILTSHFTVSLHETLTSQFSYEPYIKLMAIIISFRVFINYMGASFSFTKKMLASPMFSNGQFPQTIEGDKLDKSLEKIPRIASRVRKKNVMGCLTSRNENHFGLTRTQHLINLNTSRTHSVESESDTNVADGKPCRGDATSIPTVLSTCPTPQDWDLSIMMI